MSAFGCNGNRTPKDVTVYMPDGAPSMAFAEMMRTDEEKDGVTYTVVNPSLIASKVTNADESKNADICVLPVTAASKLLGQKQDYQMLGTVTNGNLYIISKNQEILTAFAQSQGKDLSFLKGKIIGVMKINDVPGLTLKAALNGYGLEWQEWTNGGELSPDKIHLKPIIDGSGIDGQAEDVVAYLVAEPLASVQAKKLGFFYMCSLETLYHQGEILEGYAGYPQAVLVAKRSLIETNTAWLHDFLNSLLGSVYVLATGKISGEEIVRVVQAHLEDDGYKTTLNASVFTAEVIARCGVYVQQTVACEEAVQLYLSRIASLDSAVQPMQDGFFYRNWKNK